MVAFFFRLVGAITSLVMMLTSGFVTVWNLGGIFNETHAFFFMGPSILWFASVLALCLCCLRWERSW